MKENSNAVTYADLTKNISAARVQEGKPSQYRLARKKDGSLILQGGYFWYEGTETGISWEEIPIVDLDT